MNSIRFLRNNPQIAIVGSIVLILGVSTALYMVMSDNKQSVAESTSEPSTRNGYESSGEYSEDNPSDTQSDDDNGVKKDTNKSVKGKKANTTQTKKNQQVAEKSKQGSVAGKKNSNTTSPSSPAASTPTQPPIVPQVQKKNCIVTPSVCGYPDQTNTGVKPGTVLANRGSINITQDGYVLQNVNLTGQVIIRADNVTIRNSRITSGDYYPIDYDGSTGLLVEDVEIAGTNTNVTAGLSFNNYTARRVNIHGTVDGFKANTNVLIEDSYVHSLRYDPVTDTHNDGLQATGGSNVTMRRSTIKLGGVPGISSIIQMGHEWSGNSNWLIEGNLLDGGGWVFNASDNPTKYSNITVRNNRFTRAHGYGPGGQIPNSVWSGNYYDNDLSVVPR